MACMQACLARDGRVPALIGMEALWACWCINSIINPNIRTQTECPPNNCPTPIDSDESCGSANHAAVYFVRSLSFENCYSSAPGYTTCGAGGLQRIWNNGCDTKINSVSSPIACLQACVQRDGDVPPFVGMEYGHECFCVYTIISPFFATNIRPQSECTANVCSAPIKPGDLCGGTSRTALYRVLLTSLY